MKKEATIDKKINKNIEDMKALRVFKKRAEKLYQEVIKLQSEFAKLNILEGNSEDSLDVVVNEIDNLQSALDEDIKDLVDDISNIVTN